MEEKILTLEQVAEALLRGAVDPRTVVFFVGVLVRNVIAGETLRTVEVTVQESRMRQRLEDGGYFEARKEYTFQGVQGFAAGAQMVLNLTRLPTPPAVLTFDAVIRLADRLRVDYPPQPERSNPFDRLRPSDQ